MICCSFFSMDVAGITSNHYAGIQLFKVCQVCKKRWYTNRPHDWTGPIPSAPKMNFVLMDKLWAKFGIIHVSQDAFVRIWDESHINKIINLPTTDFAESMEAFIERNQHKLDDDMLKDIESFVMLGRLT